MTEQPRFATELWELDRIKVYPKNAKKHPPEQVQKLATAIKQFGWTQPIVVDADGVIIAGHGRRLAALELGLKRVPVVCRRDLSKRQADALRLADNKVVSTDYDTVLMQAEMASLKDLGMDLKDLGFDESDMKFMLADLTAFGDDDLFVEDVGEAVEEQLESNRKKVKEVDESAAPLVDALGFKRVTIAQSRRIRIWMSQIEEETGLKGADALVKYIDDSGF